MRVLLQRVSQASVSVDGQISGNIGAGLVVFVGAGAGDDDQDLDYLVDKVLHLRIFADQDAKMNLSMLDVGAQMLVVSQFTLYADTRRGRRPSFGQAMDARPAQAIYEAFIDRVRQQVDVVQTGQFGRDMAVELVNDGPVTIWLDSRER